LIENIANIGMVYLIKTRLLSINQNSGFTLSAMAKMIVEPVPQICTGR